MSGERLKLFCDADGPCAFHAEGGPIEDKCPDMCDAPVCRALGTWLLIEAPVPLPENPAHYCTEHMTVVVCRARLETQQRAG